MIANLVIGDTHLPFVRKGYFEFVVRIYQHLKKRFKKVRVIHIGDLVDNHAISYHEHDPNGLSPHDEMELVDKQLKKWFKAFPELYLCRGNHDSLVDRKGRTVGLPERCFRDFREIWKLPDGWKDDFSWEFDGVLYTHGASTGRYAHVQHAIDNRQSTVIGHLHSVAGVEWLASEKDCIFGMCVGCGIDRHEYAFRYGKDFRRKPILACGVVEYNGRYGHNPYVLKMSV